MRYISLFSGVGGFDLGLDRAGYTCAAQVEIDPFCLRVLAKHWPDVPRFPDIHDFNRGSVNGAIDLVAGGFPCQPFSSAGKRGGAADDRNLWPQMFRIVQEFNPRWLLAENVLGIVGLYLDDILFDLEAEGYETGTVVLPACAFGAPHIRKRVFIVAHSYYNAGPPTKGQHDPDGQGGGWEKEASGFATRRSHGGAGGMAHSEGGGWSETESNLWLQRQADPIRSGQAVPDANSERCKKQRGGKPTKEGYASSECGGWWETEPGICRVVDGFPGRVDRLRALGNAVVPQVVEFLGRVIMEADQQH